MATNVSNAFVLDGTPELENLMDDTYALNTKLHAAAALKKFRKSLLKYQDGKLTVPEKSRRRTSTESGWESSLNIF